MVRRKVLTDRMISRIKPGLKRLTISDPELRGHYLRITPTGAKSFVVVARSPGGKQIWATLGGADVQPVSGDGGDHGVVGGLNARDRGRVVGFLGEDVERARGRFGVVLGAGLDGRDRDLEELAVEVEKLMNENETLLDVIEELKTSLGEYKKIEKELQTTLLNLQDSSARSIETAKKQAGTMIKEAESEAAGIIDKAKKNANEIRDAVINLREEKNLIISKLKAIVNTQSTLLEGKVKKIDGAEQEMEKTKQQRPKDDLDVDVDDIVNKLL